MERGRGKCWRGRERGRGWGDGGEGKAGAEVLRVKELSLQAADPSLIMFEVRRQVEKREVVTRGIV